MMGKPTEDQIAAFVADKVMSEVKSWFDGEKFEEDDVRSDLRKAFAYAADGYQVARALDDAHWFVDAALVEILDDAFMYRAEAMRTLEEDQT
jgi:hypothetical protein